MVKRDKVEDLAKRKLKINRVPENTKREFIELAEQEFCLGGEEKIICFDGEKYFTKKIKNMKDYDGLVISYNFDNKKIEPKKITNWSKTRKKMYKVNLKNGTNIISSLSHRFYRLSQSNKTMYLESLGDIKDNIKDASLKKRKYAYRKLLSLKKLPAINSYPERDISDLFVQGAFVAEGTADKSGNKITIYNYGETVIKNFVREWLKNKNIYSWEDYKKICFCDRDMNEKFSKLGDIAKNKHFDYGTLGLNELQIKNLLDGYAEGDGTKNPKNRNASVFYFTTSDKLVEQLKILHWIIGKPLYYELKKVSSSQYGDRPLRKLYCFDNSHFSKELKRFPGLSKTTVKIGGIEELGERYAYDIGVEENNNFFLAKSGILAHNCGDYGMTLKFIWEEFKKTNTIYEHFDMKLNEILNRLMNSGEDNDKEEIKLMSGKKIQKGGE